MARYFRSKPVSLAGRELTGFQFGAILRDISVRKREAERIRYLAEHDTLTGLINRNPLHAKLEAKIGRAEAGRRRVALLVIGIDGFQQINDMLGLPSAISCFAPFQSGWRRRCRQRA